MSENATKPKTRDDAIAEVEALIIERHRDLRSIEWLHTQIERLEFFSEDEIWELLESYR